MTSAADGENELFNRFSCYVLPGRVSDPIPGLNQAREAERLGLGSVWISERFATKEPAALSGAISQITNRITISGSMFVTLRNPVVTASVANIMQALSAGRFRLVLPKGVPKHLAQMGSPAITFERLADYIRLLRGLWSGESINYNGILGKFPDLHITDLCEVPAPPIINTAIGPKSLAFAGAHCDGVLLHPFLTLDGVRKSIDYVKRGACEAGKDPESVKVYATVIVSPDLVDSEKDAVIGGRGITYFQMPKLGEMLCTMNGWDTQVLDKIRNHKKFRNLGSKLAEQSFTREELVEVSRLIPPEWLDGGAIFGTPNTCAISLCDYLDAGVDEIVLHGTTPEKMQPLTNELKQKLG